MRYQLVIFDWDGTVMDSVPKIVNTLKLAAHACGAEIPTDEATKAIIGLSLPTAIAQLFPNDEDKWETLRLGYKRIYSEVDDTPTPLFDGAIRLLDTLRARGVKIAVATGKSTPGLERLMAESNTVVFFETYRTADDAKSKPDPDMINQILTQLACSPEQAVMIGDSVLDMQMASAASVDAIGMTHGAATRQALSDTQAFAVVDNYEQLTEVLLLQ